MHTFILQIRLLNGQLEENNKPFSENPSVEKNQITTIEIMEEPITNVMLSPQEDERFKQLLQE